MTTKERIEKALEFAKDGAYDGSHHKMWAIDQMVRSLTGCPIVEKDGIDHKGRKYTFKGMGESQEYLDWIKNYENGEDGPNTYE